MHKPHPFPPLQLVLQASVTLSIDIFDSIKNLIKIIIKVNMYSF